MMPGPPVVCLTHNKLETFQLIALARSSMEASLMVHEMIDGIYRQTNLPNESPEYLSKREELQLAEIE